MEGEGETESKNGGGGGRGEDESQRVLFTFSRKDLFTVSAEETKAFLPSPSLQVVETLSSANLFSTQLMCGNTHDLHWVLGNRSAHLNMM